MTRAWASWREEHPDLDVHSDAANNALVSMAYAPLDADVLEVLRPLVASLFWQSEADGKDALYGSSPRGVLRSIVAETLLTEVRS